jgi:predicted DNA-binding transcriptional regulator YafY
VSIIQTPEITTERVAVIVYLLARGRRFRTSEVADLCGVTQRGAYAIMARISRVVPLTLDGGEWTEYRPPADDNGETDGKPDE